MCSPRGLLLIASLMSLRDAFGADWIWIQLRRLRGVGISAQQTTARFDMCFFFSSFLPSKHRNLLPREPPLSPSRSGLAVMDWHPLSVKPALWLFNEAAWQRRNSAAAAAASMGNSIKGPFPRWSEVLEEQPRVLA